MSNPWHDAIDDILDRCILAPMDEERTARQRLTCGTMLSTTAVAIKAGLDDEQIGSVLKSAAEMIARDLGLDPLTPSGETYLTINSRMRSLVIREARKLATAEKGSSG